MKDYSLDYRHYVIGGVALLIVVVYMIRLFMLQITSDDYKKSADSNAFLKKIEYPSRGGIYDRYRHPAAILQHATAKRAAGPRASPHSDVRVGGACVSMRRRSGPQAREPVRTKNPAENCREWWR